MKSIANIPPAEFSHKRKFQGTNRGKTIAKTKNCKSKVGSEQLHGKTAKVNGERRNSILVVWTKYFSPK